MTANLRVLHVICTENFAGAERHVATLARAQSQQGLDVTVMGGRRDSMTAALTGTTVRWAAAGSVAAALRRGSRLPADVIHTHMSAADLSGAMLGRLRRIPVVSTRHFAAQRGRGGLQRAVMMRVSRHVDAQIAISHFVAEAIEGESTVVHAGVPEAEIRPVDRDRTVVVVQRLEKEKETEVALEAWKSLGDLREGWRLVIVGDGSRRPALEAMTRAARITDSVSFAGFQSDIASRLAAASIFVATAPREPYGLSVVEAMAAGTPVVATRAGGHLETVGSAPDAFLYAASDSRALAEQLAALMADPGRRRQYGDELRELQRSRFSLERQAEETSRVYQEVAS